MLYSIYHILAYIEKVQPTTLKYGLPIMNERNKLTTKINISITISNKRKISKRKLFLNTTCLT